MKTHSLITTLLSLRGNPRGCVYTEPLWGIPFNLYAPYISVYMLALGLRDAEIGLILSISWGFQIVFALLSGVITDKLGRRFTTLLFDIIAWGVPAAISAVAQNFWFFLVAGMINSVWRVTLNSWTCLLVEDAEQDKLVDMYTWIHISNQFVGFVAPVTGLIIQTYQLIPTMRGLYTFAAIMFTLKAFITYALTHETVQGQIRMRETRQQSFFHGLGEYWQVVSKLLHNPATLYTAGLMLVLSIAHLISGSFWAILVTEKLNVPAENLSWFPFVKSIIILAFFFIVMPYLNKLQARIPMIIGFIGFLGSQLILINTPEQGYAWLVLSVFLEACSFAAISPLMDQMLALTVDPADRARIQSILYVAVILLTAPFGWIAGTLSSINKDLPFILSMSLFIIGAVLAYLAGRVAYSVGKPIIDAEH